jgi:hypothetical protein
VGHSAKLRGGVGSTFSQEQCIRPTLLGQRERLPRMGTTGGRSVHVVCIRFLLQDEHRFKLIRLSDMSNHLSCGHQHIANYWYVVY